MEPPQRERSHGVQLTLERLLSGTSLSLQLNERQGQREHHFTPECERRRCGNKTLIQIAPLHRWTARQQIRNAVKTVAYHRSFLCIELFTHE